MEYDSHYLYQLSHEYHFQSLLKIFFQYILNYEYYSFRIHPEKIVKNYIGYYIYWYFLINYCIYIITIELI